MKQRHLDIIGMGTYLPSRKITSTHIDVQMGYPDNTTYCKTGIKTRYYADDRSASVMATHAVNAALTDAKITLDDIDCLIAASGTHEQAIPCNAALIHKALNAERPIPTFDVNMTCLSSLLAIDLASCLLQTHSYKKILIVASDIASVGINWQDIKIGGNFGDGAAALIIASNEKHPQYRILSSKIETYSEGSEFCTIPGGGSKLHPKYRQTEYMDDCYFKMQGKAIYRLASKVLPPFIDDWLQQQRLNIQNIDWVVPHQASVSALKHMRKKLGIERHKMIDIITEHGNQIAVSLLFALKNLFDNKLVKTGDKILLIGTGAGLVIGGMLIEVLR